jgi:hypothetical protein
MQEVSQKNLLINQLEKRLKEIMREKEEDGAEK